MLCRHLSESRGTRSRIQSGSSAKILLWSLEAFALEVGAQRDLDIIVWTLVFYRSYVEKKRHIEITNYYYVML